VSPRAPRPARPLRHRLAAGLRVGCLSLLAFAVLGEIAARLWDRAHGKTGTLYDEIVDTGHRFKMRSGASVLVPERYGDILYRFNRDGYRGGEPTPGEGVRRIVLLGDSVSFGLGVDQDRLFAARLEQRLRRDLRQPWDVLNLGIFAYHTGHELETLETDGLKHRPEIVLVQFYMNDLIAPPENAAAGRSAVKAPPPTFLQRLAAARNVLLYRSALYRRAHQAVTGLTFRLAHDLRRRRFPETLNDTEPRGDLAFLARTPDDEAVGAFRALRRIRDVARAHGARTLVLVSPDEVQLFKERFDGIDRRIAAFCRKEGIDLYDALPDLRTAPDRADLYLDGVHLTRQGHAAMADLLFRELARRGWVTAP
jgi:lysophospholipase L1-like esterase